MWFVNQRGRLFDVYVNVTASEVLGVFCVCEPRGSRLWVGQSCSCYQRLSFTLHFSVRKLTYELRVACGDAYQRTVKANLEHQKNVCKVDKKPGSTSDLS